MSNRKLPEKVFGIIKVLTIVFLGCGIFLLALKSNENGGENPPPIKSQFFIPVETFKSDPFAKFQCIYRHRDTNVLYAYIGNGSSSSITVLVNPDGSPMIWDGGSENEQDNSEQN